MPFYPLRSVAVSAEARARNTAWLAQLDTELERPDCDRNAFARRVLTELHFPELAGRDPETLPPGARIALDQMDPRNVTLEPEYYHEIDPERYARVKPLLWLWEMFDRSPAGENVELGVAFRRILARRIFRRCGRNFKAFPFVRFSYGYNMEVGDDVVIHRHVLLDDRGGIRLGNRVSVSDFANVYSHSHDIVDPREVVTPVTVLGDGVRVTYHATILAGVHVAEDSMVGAMALATRDTEPSTVHVGIPAKPVRRKPEPGRRQGPPDPLSSDG
jgi:acetyltransferase-like isoleucine patch superfamily enzyme